MGPVGGNRRGEGGNYRLRVGWLNSQCRRRIANSTDHRRKTEAGATTLGRVRNTVRIVIQMRNCMGFGAQLRKE
jgi:hypothetical protein